MALADQPQVKLEVYDLLVAAFSGFTFEARPIEIPVTDHPPRDPKGVFVIMDGFAVQDRSAKNAELANHPFLIRVHIRRDDSDQALFGLDLVTAVTIAAHVR